MSWTKLIHKKAQKQAEPMQEHKRKLRPMKRQHSLSKNFTGKSSVWIRGIQVDTRTGKLQY